jgi:two-component system, NtrC family, sensor kinase
VTLSLKGANSPTRGRKLRSTGTKAGTRVAASDESQAALVTKLKAHARDLAKKLEARTRQLAEARDQQTATSEVLSVISSSPGELEPVFQAMLANAVRICEARFGNLLLSEGDCFRNVALHDAPAEFAELRRRNPVILPSTVMVRMRETKQPVQHADMTTMPGYLNRDPSAVALVELAGARTLLSVPMLKQGEVVGAINIYRQEVRPFTDKQIELVKNFAAQAVIAIENTRLLNELRQRTDDLSEVLEQQTATSEVLQVISSSPGELEPVFETMLGNAVRICEAKFGNLLLYDGDAFRFAAMHGAPPAWDELRRRDPVIRVGPNNPLSRVIATKQLQHIADFRKEQAYVDREPPAVALAEVAGARTVVVVPMLKENALLGVIAVYRQEVRPFTEKQIELVKNFAAQAVIAIENTRLLNELRESLQQQTATADVLKVISRSTFDLQTVLDTLVESAARLCNAYDAVVLLREGVSLVFRAHHGPIPIHFVELPITRATTAGRAVLEHKPIHVRDITAERDEFPEAHALALRQGHRTILSVPLLREDEAIGCLVVRRTEARAFSTKQIELAATFADQAVIAIENVRLFEEVQARTRELSEALEQQTATSEVLRVISSSPGELQPVFEAMLANATRLCEAKFATLWLCEGNGFRSVALHNAPPAFADQQAREPVIHPGPATALGRVATTKQVAQVADVKTDRAYRERDPVAVASVELAGMRTLISVPMLKEGELIGAISIIARKCDRSPTSRSSCSRASPAKPSSRSRTPACSTSCVSRYSSRPPPPTCSRSSAARPSICRRCSTRWSNRRRDCARRTP